MAPAIRGRCVALCWTFVCRFPRKSNLSKKASPGSFVEHLSGSRRFHANVPDRASRQVVVSSQRRPTCCVLPSGPVQHRELPTLAPSVAQDSDACPLLGLPQERLKTRSFAAGRGALRLHDSRTHSHASLWHFALLAACNGTASGQHTLHLDNGPGFSSLSPGPREDRELPNLGPSVAQGTDACPLVFCGLPQERLHPGPSATRPGALHVQNARTQSCNSVPLWTSSEFSRTPMFDGPENSGCQNPSGRRRSGA